MILQQQVATDLRLRAALLPREAQDWRARTDQDVGGMGIHRTQVIAVNVLLDGLQARQTRLLAALEPTLPAEDFAQKRALLESELTGAHGIAAVFRYMLAQRSDRERYGTVLDAADRIAADCYNASIARAESWGALKEDKRRAPPLTYFHTASSALALTRRSTLAMIGLKMEGHSERKLPIPVIALPFHQAVAPWTLCALYHEVGHLLDQDLNLRAALGDRLRAKLTAGGSERSGVWGDWVPELIADTFGVLFGGADFASSMVTLLLLPEARVTEMRAGDEHPPDYLRVFLIAALLRGSGAPALVAAAGRIEQTWRSRYAGTDELAPYVEECELVAKALLDQRLLVELQNHSLREFAPTPAEDDARTAGLAGYLSGGEDPPEARGFPIRLVPAAAQRAVDGAAETGEEQFRAIQQRALDFVEDIPRPRTMDIGDFPAARLTYLRGLVQELDFGAPGG